METVLWIFLGLVIGAPIGFVISPMLGMGKVSDLYMELASKDTEIGDLRSVRVALKEEIFRLDTKLNDKKTYN